MSPSVQAVQSSHALLDFAAKYPADFLQWHKTSNYLCQVSVENGQKLFELIEKAQRLNIKFVPFYEPDLDNSLTSIALEPTDVARKLVNNLPLLLKEVGKTISTS